MYCVTKLNTGLEKGPFIPMKAGHYVLTAKKVSLSIVRPSTQKCVFFFCLHPLKYLTWIIPTCIDPEFVTRKVFSHSSSEDN